MLSDFEVFVTSITTCYKFLQRIKLMEMHEFDLRGTHVMCIYYLQRNPDGLTASRLAQLCGEDKGAISRTLAILQEKGLIHSGEKKYRTPIYLTEAGKTIAEQVDEMIIRWVSCGGFGITEEERRCFREVMEKVERNLGAKLETCERLKAGE